MDKQTFLNSELKDISQVYEGKRDCCRCGCGGEYYATTFMEVPRSVVDDKKVQECLDRAKKIATKKTSTVDFGDTYVDVQTGRNRTLTFYFDEVKK